VSSPFLAEIRAIPYDFVPEGWAACDGSLAPIHQNSALFSLLGTAYGGDGINWFALPDLRDRMPMMAGTGPGLDPRRLGETGGADTVKLDLGTMPNHTHALNVSNKVADSPLPTGNTLARYTAGAYQQNTKDNLVPLWSGTLQIRGMGRVHNNLQPYLALQFVIAIEGAFPS
jgi:microcystin-dependent protein